jgi:hypothetical protein
LAESKMYTKVAMIFTEMHFSEVKDDFSISIVRSSLMKLGWKIPTDITAGNILLFDTSGNCIKNFKDTKFTKKKIKTIYTEILSNTSILHK